MYQNQCIKCLFFFFLTGSLWLQPEPTLTGVALISASLFDAKGNSFDASILEHPSISLIEVTSNDQCFRMPTYSIVCVFVFKCFTQHSSLLLQTFKTITPLGQTTFHATPLTHPAQTRPHFLTTLSWDQIMRTDGGLSNGDSSNGALSKHFISLVFLSTLVHCFLLF